MAQGVNTTRLLPDPDLVSRNVAHRREVMQVTIDALNRMREEAPKLSEPFNARVAIGRLHPLFKSTIEVVV